MTTEKQISTVFVNGVLTCETPLAQIEGKDEARKELILKHRTDSYLVPKREWVPEDDDENGKRGHYELVPGEYTIARIPAPSSNTLRARIRDLISLNIASKLPPLGQKTLFFLYGGGGGFDEKSKKGATVELIKKIREKNVLAGLLGGSVGGAIIPGKVVVGMPVLYCRDLMGYIPAGVIGKGEEEMPTDPNKLPDARSFLTAKQYTRNDDLKLVEIHDMLTDAGKAELNVEEEASAAARSKDTEKDKNGNGDKKGVKRQAIYHVESVAAGAQYYSHFFVRKPTERELGAFLSSFEEFAKDPYIGGMSSKGFGEISLVCRVTVNYTDGTGDEGSFLVNVDRDKKCQMRDESGFMAAAMGSYRGWLDNLTMADIDVDNL